jgi:hypothetical protein
MNVPHAPLNVNWLITTSAQLLRWDGWSGKKNGELLRLMNQEGFTILLTTDQNLRYQQNLEQSGVAVVVLVARSNRLPDLVPLIPDVRSVLSTIVPGEVIEVGGS